MDFAAAIAFLFLYYIRPQEWVPGVAFLHPVTVVMGLALIFMFRRMPGFSLREAVKTPHDWLMLCYFLWIVGTGTNPIAVLGEVYNLFLFYLVTVLALSNLGRIQTYLWWWTGLILMLAVLAVASLYGFDPMGSRDVTEGVMQNRLSLGTLIFNNPNALGHSVGPVLLLLYFSLVWNRPLFVAVTSIPPALLVVYCVYQTASKGAFFSVACTLTAGLCFGRSRLVQLWILILALGLGVAGLRQLPRMSTMENPEAEEGIQRRLIAFRYGYTAMQDNFTGLGYGRFVGEIRKVHTRLFASPHSSYVQAGSEFGIPGLYLFCGILYACYRTLLSVRVESPGQDRVRRLLFVLLFSYCVSSWMIEWSMRATFFLLVAVIAAFHRHLLVESMAVAAAAPTAAGLKGDGRLWNRLRLVDHAMICLVTFLTMQFWRYVMTSV